MHEIERSNISFKIRYLESLTIVRCISFSPFSILLLSLVWMVWSFLWISGSTWFFLFLIADTLISFRTFWNRLSLSRYMTGLASELEDASKAQHSIIKLRSSECHPVMKLKDEMLMVKVQQTYTITNNKTFNVTLVVRLSPLGLSGRLTC